MIGHIATSRSIMDLPFYTDDKAFKLFYHCLLKANFKSKNWQGTMINRGQFVTSYSNLSEELSWSVQNVRTCVSKLEKLNALTRYSTAHYTIITVCAYEAYASCNVETVIPANSMLTEHQQSTNTGLTTTKERNKGIKINKNIAQRNDSNDGYYNKRMAFDAIENIYSTAPAQIENINQEFKKYNDFLLTEEFIKEHLSSFYVMDFNKYKYYNDQSVADALQKHLKARYDYSDKKASKSLKNQTDYKAYLVDFFDNHHIHHKNKKDGSKYYIGALQRTSTDLRYPEGELQYRLDVFKLIRSHLIKLHNQRFKKYKNLTIFTMIDVLLDKVVTVYPVDKKRLLNDYKTITYDEIEQDKRWIVLQSFLENQTEYKVKNTHIRRLLQDEKDKNQL